MRQRRGPPRPARLAAWVAGLLLAASGCGGGGAPALTSASLPPCAVEDSCELTATRNAAGACVKTYAADGTACHSNHLCAAGTFCAGGTCQGGTPMEGPCVPDLAALELTGCSSSDYAVGLQVGGETFHLIVDSGSTVTAVAGASCGAGCSGLDPLYRPSSAGAATGGTAQSTYGDRSGWSGSIFRDQVALPGIGKPFDFAFAAMTSATVQSSDSTAFFVPDYCSGTARSNTRQGILGLGNREIAGPSGAETLMDVLPTLGFQDVFSTQFCNTAGRLWFGGFAPGYLDGPPAYTKMATADGYYRIGVDDILIGGSSLGLSASAFGGMPVVDNGTSTMDFPSAVVDAVTTALANNAAFAAQFSAEDLFASGGACSAPRQVSLTRAQLDATLPTFALVLPEEGGSGKIAMTMPATASYLTYLSTPGGDVYCPTLLSNDSDGSSSAAADNPSIIGNAAMRSHIVIFDRQGQRLGVAPQRGCIGPDL